MPRSLSLRCPELVEGSKGQTSNLQTAPSQPAYAPLRTGTAAPQLNSSTHFHIATFSYLHIDICDVYTNALDPGWVPTKMGGSGAPDDLQKGYETQVWLAVSNDKKAKVSGRFFFHQKETRCNPDAADVELQEKFIELCRELTGIELKEH